MKPIHPVPPRGYRPVDKEKDDPKDFADQKRWNGANWVNVGIKSKKKPWGDYCYAVPIEPGEGYQLIDSTLDKVVDHPDAEEWDEHDQEWRAPINLGTYFLANRVYRTPFSSVRAKDQWIRGAPYIRDVGKFDPCWITTGRGEVLLCTGSEARGLSGNNGERTIAWRSVEQPPPYVPPKSPESGDFWRRTPKGPVVHVIGKRSTGGLVIEERDSAVSVVNEEWFDTADHLANVTSFDDAEVSDG